MNSSIITKLEDLIKNEGFDHFGFTHFDRPLSLNIYQHWLEQGHQGEMNYLETHLPAKSSPQSWLPQAQSAIVIAINYLPHPEPLESLLKSLKIARYARGSDYHYFFKQRLKDLTKILKLEFPDHYFSAHTDSDPIMERDLGYKAQLGWFGKNSCMIHPKKGSFFLLGEILTSLPLQSSGDFIPDFCGHCRRCIDQCPTQAIREDRTLEAQRCISYLNIELKGLPKENLIPLMGDWFFGCDICQEVCPWNKKAFGETLQDKPPNREQTLEDLRFLLTSSNKSLERNFKHTPLWRRRAFGLKRNALIICYNLKATELLPEISALQTTSKDLQELSKWVFKKLVSDSPPKVEST